MLRRLGLPLGIILIGLGGYFSATGILPPINWVWPGLVAIFGVVLLIIDRLSAFNFTVGLTLISIAIVLVLRQANLIPVDATFPLSLVSGGVMWLVSVLIFRNKSSS